MGRGLKYFSVYWWDSEKQKLLSSSVYSTLSVSLVSFRWAGFSAFFVRAVENIMLGVLTVLLAVSGGGDGGSENVLEISCNEVIVWLKDEFAGEINKFEDFKCEPGFGDSVFGWAGWRDLSCSFSCCERHL